MKKALLRFANLVGQDKIEVYNEASLQYELGFFLRNNCRNLKIHFERNVADSDLFRHKRGFVKKEIDIVLFSSGNNRLNCAIEVKYPNNGKYPEQMYSFCEDIRFLEQLKEAGFKHAFFFVAVRDHLFWEGPLQTGIYSYFRGHRALKGRVRKPTGNTKRHVDLDGSYQFKWHVDGNIKHGIVEI